ncbi:hypothetical protein ACP70R_033708 [Stipagrostis hirtigluma subsp. patula]
MSYQVPSKQTDRAVVAAAMAAATLLWLQLPAVARGQLQVGFYNTSCPNAETLVQQAVANAFANDSSIAAGLIRLHFHDCFVRFNIYSAVAMASSALICDTEQWKALQGEFEGIFLDYSRQQATGETMEKLLKLAEAAKLKEKIEKMFKGDNEIFVGGLPRDTTDGTIGSDGEKYARHVQEIIDFGATGRVGGLFQKPYRLMKCSSADGGCQRCTIWGCDASVLLTSPNGTAERDAAPNNPSLRGFQVIDAAKAAVEQSCARTVSCAGIVAFAARDSINLTGNVSYQVPSGRRDGNVSIDTEALSNLPQPTFTAQQLVASFANKSLTAEEMVVLSGAHTVGRSFCTSFLSRIYNGSTPIVDTGLSAGYATLLRALCPSNANASTPATAATDPSTPLQENIALVAKHCDENLFCH